MNNLLTLPSILSMTGRYLLLVGISGVLAVVVGIAIGILVTRPTLKPIAPILLAIVNIGQSVPSLAVLALSLGFLGLGLKPAVIALFLYSLLPVVRNTAIGIRGVDPSLREAALGMGMHQNEILFGIELPLATPVMMSGIRTALIVNVGTAAMGSLIGAGGIGNLIFTGLSMEMTSEILVGAAIIAVIAIALDLGLEALTHRISPQGIPQSMGDAA